MGKPTSAGDVAAAVAEEMGIPLGLPLTEDEAAEFRQRFEDAMKEPGPPRVMPQPPALTPEAIRTLLRECVTVIKPGETLIVRVPWATPARTVYELGRVLHEQAEAAGAGFHTLVVPAAEIGAGEGPQETVHACPPDGGGPMPCCGRTPFEASRWHRMTMEPGLVTCGGTGG
jgi:hypothetical protein